MTSPQPSNNLPPRPQTSPPSAPDDVSRPTGGQPIDLTGASLAAFGEVPTLSLTALEKAAELLWPGELRAHVVTRINDIHNNRLTPPSESTIVDAFVSTYGASEGEREAILSSFLASAHQHAWPVAGYAKIVDSSPETKHLYPDRSLANALSLLQRGVLPIEEVAPHLRAMRLSLHDSAFDKAKTYLPILVGAGVASIGALAPAWATVAGGIAGISACALFAKRMSLRNEFAAGLHMESLDAFRTISRGEVLPIGAALNGLFNDPRISENYGNLLRADAFMVARTLRVFGVSTDDIFATFRDSTTSYSAGELLIGKVIAVLEAHGLTPPPLLVIPFLDDPINQERDNDARDLIEIMNQVHFEWAIHEKGVIRQNFAKAILDAKS